MATDRRYRGRVAPLPDPVPEPGVAGVRGVVVGAVAPPGRDVPLAGAPVAGVVTPEGLVVDAGPLSV